MGTRSFCVLVGVVFLIGAKSSEAGKSIHPRSLDDIKKTLGTILAPDDKKADENTTALRKLKAYRYLSGLPYEDVTLDDKYNQMCVAGAKLCEKIGKLDHTPKNPGLPEDEYKLAYKGTSQSNLAEGFRTLSAAVDGWMDDSDEANIDRLGHRRWCLNPTMQKTGFGQAGEFTAMFSFDRNRKKVPDYDFICYPARGYMPIAFFGANRAWSVTLNPKKYKTPAKGFEPKIFAADDMGMKQGEPLTLNYKNVDAAGFGIANCIIFRPEKLALTPGARYVVELEGIQPQVGKKTVTLRYVVEFASVK
jgi:uncharacterized protein YkwD